MTIDKTIAFFMVFSFYIMSGSDFREKPFWIFLFCSRIRREMDSFWNRFLGEIPFFRPPTEEWAPSVDISETEDKGIIRAEIPGLEAKDVSVTLSGIS